MDKQWSPSTRTFVLVVLIILAVLSLYLARELLAPIVVSALLAYVLFPVVSLLENRTPLKRKISVFIVLVITLALVALIPVTVTPIVFDLIDSMDIELHQILTGIDDFLSQTEVFGIKIFQGVPQNMEDSLTSIIHPENVFSSIYEITENIVWIFVILITVYYFLIDWERMRSWVYNLLPRDYHPDAIRLYRRLTRIWGEYLRGQLLTMFLVGLVSGVAAAIVGIPGAIVLGVVAAILAVVPSVGSSSMVFVAGLVALFSKSATFNLSTFWFVAVTVIVFVCIHLFDNYWLRPRILGHGLHIHPGVVLVGVVGALLLGGPLLTLVIVPVISTAEMLLRYIISRMTGTNPWADEEFTPEEGD